MTDDEPVGADASGPVGLCAAGEAAWHRAAHEALGVPWREDGALARAPDGPGHYVLLGAVTLVPRPAVPGDQQGPVCDSFAAFTDADLPRHRPVDADPWMVRDPGESPATTSAPAPPGLDVRPATTDDDVLLFERIAFVANGSLPPGRPGELHPPGSQHVPGLHLFLGRLNGDAAGTALAVEHEKGVVVTGVAVLSGARRRGLGAALTAACVAVAPEKPATLASSDMAIGLYTRLGFRELSRPVHWHPR